MTIGAGKDARSTGIRPSAQAVEARWERVQTDAQPRHGVARQCRTRVQRFRDWRHAFGAAMSIYPFAAPPPRANTTQLHAEMSTGYQGSSDSPTITEAHEWTGT